MASKIMRKHYDDYIKSNYTSISRAYNRPSANKIEAWRRCQDICVKHNGSGLKVIGMNTYCFTAGFMTNDTFYFITKAHISAISKEALKNVK